MRCIESGEPDAPPLVMLPGWGCSAYAFRHNIVAFAEAGYRAIVIEPPGQGWSDKPEDEAEHTLPLLARRVLAVFDGLQIAVAPIVGQSLGGRIALQIALDAPARASRLALWSPIGFGCARLVHAGSHLPLWAAPFFARLAGRLAVRASLHLVYGRGARVEPRDVDQYRLPIRSPGFARSQIALLRNVRWDPLTADEIARLTLPALVVAGTRDPLVPMRCLTDAAETLPNGRLYVVQEAGHAANETQAELVNRETLAFLRAPHDETTS